MAAGRDEDARVAGERRELRRGSGVAEEQRPGSVEDRERPVGQPETGPRLPGGDVIDRPQEGEDVVGWGLTGARDDRAGARENQGESKESVNAHGE